MLSFLFYVFLLFLVLPSLGHASIEAVPCPGLRSNSSCGELTVPLDYANPSTSTNISMLYAVIYPSSPGSFDSALVLIPGGPGGAALTDLQGGLTSLEVVDQLKRPLILFDPRGTGNASRLNCSLQSKPSTVDIDLLDLRRCLHEIGPEVLHYSSTAIVNDLETLRNALGVRQLDLYGVSYGTLISQAYGVLYPDSIRSMILDSPLPMRYRDVYQVRHYSAYDRIYAEKNKLNPLFSRKKFPAELKSVLNRLRWNRALREHLGIDQRLLSFMYSLTLDSFTDAIGSAANENNYSALIQIAKNLEPTVQPLRNFSIAMQQATICNSAIDLLPWEVDARFFERLASLVYDVWRKVAFGAFSPFSLVEGFGSLLRHCAAMPFTQLRSEGLPLDKGLQKKIPVLVVIGDLDPVTPVEDLVDLDPVFRENVALVKGAGHVVSQHPCGGLLLLEFAISGAVRNMSACE